MFFSLWLKQGRKKYQDPSCGKNMIYFSKEITSFMFLTSWTFQFTAILLGWCGILASCYEVVQYIVFWWLFHRGEKITALDSWVLLKQSSRGQCFCHRNTRLQLTNVEWVNFFTIKSVCNTSDAICLKLLKFSESHSYS